MGAFTKSSSVIIKKNNMSTWVKDDERTWVQKLFAGVLKQGPLPRHVGFILDGYVLRPPSSGTESFEFPIM